LVRYFGVILSSTGTGSPEAGSMALPADLWLIPIDSDQLHSA
jgi:hypothetical protein